MPRTYQGFNGMGQLLPKKPRHTGQRKALAGINGFNVVFGAFLCCLKMQTVKVITMPKIGVLALQGDFREHLASLDGLGQSTCMVRTPADLAQVDALVIPGGESSVIDRLSRNYGLAEPIMERIAEGMPAYGSCAGMIMLAQRLENPAISRDGAVQQSFGGIDMTVKRNAFGRQIDSFEHQLDFNGRSIQAVFIRAPEAVQVGPEVQVLSTVQAGPGSEQGRIVAVRQGNLLATSFHPEVTGSTAIHEFFINLTRGDA